MDVKRYLIFNYDNEFIRLSMQKIKGKKLIILGNHPDDVKKYRPSSVLCYQNPDVADRCKILKVNCIYLYTLAKFNINSCKYLCTMVISPFDLSRVSRDDKNHRYNFTMIGDSTDKISKLMKQFEYGHNVLSNPGEVTTSQILDYYKKERKNLVNGENRTSISSFPGFIKIQNYFTEKEVRRKLLKHISNIYLQVQ